MNRLILSTLVLGAVAATLPAQLRKTVVASGLASPLFLTYSHAGDARLFIVEQAGRIRVYKNGALLPSPFLNITTKILSGGERGLLGLAFSPNYATNGWFYVSYTRSGDGASILERYSVSATNPDVADPNSGLVLQNPIAQPYSNHNGGCIQFGPDGYLYFGLGDGGSGGDPGCRAQNRLNLLGKMLRLDVDNHPNIIPASNPFVGSTSTHEKIWALGLRNPWRFSFDRLTGDMYIGDVGQNAVEEVSFQPASSRGGENYGWNSMEGNACYGACAGAPACNSPTLVRPIQTYATGGNCTVVGGYVYRGCAIPSLRGTYFYGDYCSGAIWSFRYANGQLTDARNQTGLLGPVGSLASFGEDANGELYMVSLGGIVYRLESTQTTAVDLGFGKIGGNGLVPTFSVCGLLSAGESAEFRLDSAPASAIAAFVIGTQNNPTNFPPYGTLVPTPPLFSAPFVTDAQGQIRFTLPGGTGAATVYAQWLVVDAGATGGIGVSNALQVFLR